MRFLALLAFVAVLSCATAAAPNSLVRNKRLSGLLNLNGVGNLLGDVLNPVVGTVGNVLTSVTDALQPVLGPLLQAVSNLLTQLLEVVQELVQALTGLLRQASILEYLADVVDEIVPTVEAAVSGLGDGNLEAALAPVARLVDNLLSGVLETVGAANLPLVGDIVGTLGDILQGAFRAVAEALFRNILQNLPNLPVSFKK